MPKKKTNMENKGLCTLMVQWKFFFMTKPSFQSLLPRKLFHKEESLSLHCPQIEHNCALSHRKCSLQLLVPVELYKTHIQYNKTVLILPVESQRLGKSMLSVGKIEAFFFKALDVGFSFHFLSICIKIIRYRRSVCAGKHTCIEPPCHILRC